MSDEYEHLIELSSGELVSPEEAFTRCGHPEPFINPQGTISVRQTMTSAELEKVDHHDQCCTVMCILRHEAWTLGLERPPGVKVRSVWTLPYTAEEMINWPKRTRQ